MSLLMQERTFVSVVHYISQWLQGSLAVYFAERNGMNTAFKSDRVSQSSNVMVTIIERKNTVPDYREM